MELVPNSSLAYMSWKEQATWSLERHCTGRFDYESDDLLCVSAADNILVSSTIGRNKMLVPEK